MGRRIVIEPVTRVEGHARVTIQLGDDGRVRDARVQITELRAFELLCARRPLLEMPALTARICGICPAAHGLASALAGDRILGSDPPPTARRLRRLLLLGQLLQSHALSFFHLSAPDFVLGHDGDPARRSILGLAEAAPELARDGVALRRLGQEVIAELAGQRVHPAFAVPGGVTRPLAPAGRDRLLAGLPEGLRAAERTFAWWRSRLAAHQDDLQCCGDFESLFLALAGPEGELCLDGGRLRFVGPDGGPVAPDLDPADYRAAIGEAVEPGSYLTLPYYRPMGHPEGLYRVGPLARLNVASRCGTPRADRALAAFRAQAGLAAGERGAVLQSFQAHLARLVEILHALERIEELLCDPATLGREVLAPPGQGAPEGVGACEAPRGTLLHHYRVDGDGLLVSCHLLVASGQNALAMNRTVRQIAERWLTGAEITPGLLNRVEAGVRAYDPCFSCATHAEGGRAVALRLLGPDGALLDEAPRPTGRADQ